MPLQALDPDSVGHTRSGCLLSTYLAADTGNARVSETHGQSHACADVLPCPHGTAGRAQGRDGAPGQGGAGRRPRGLSDSSTWALPWACGVGAPSPAGGRGGRWATVTGPLRALHRPCWDTG